MSNNELPQNWEQLQLECLGLKFHGGGTPSRKIANYWNGDIAWTTSKYIDESLYLSKFADRITEEGIKRSSTQLVPSGNILIGTRVGVGKVAINLIDMAISQDITAMIVNKDLVNPEFLVYQIRSDTIQNRISSAKRGTTINGIPRNELLGIDVKIPPISEQRKIAYILSTIQKAIEKQDQIIKTTTELKKNLMQKLFTEGLHDEPQKETEIGLVPKSWEVIELGKLLADTKYGLSKKGLESGKYPVLRMTNQDNGTTVSSNLQYVDITNEEFKKFQVKYDDVLFNRTNSFELVGKTSIYRLVGDYVFASYLIRLRCDNTRLIPEFLNNYLNSDVTQQRLKSIATRGVSQSNISATRLKGFKIPLLAITEQHDINEILVVLSNKIDVLDRKKTSLLQLFDNLLNQLMTAQIRVNDIDFENIDLVTPKEV